MDYANSAAAVAKRPAAGSNTIPATKGAVETLAPRSVPYTVGLHNHPSVRVQVLPSGRMNVIVVQRFAGKRKWTQVGAISNTHPLPWLLREARKLVTDTEEKREKLGKVTGVAVAHTLRGAFEEYLTDRIAIGKVRPETTGKDYRERMEQYFSKELDQPISTLDVERIWDAGKVVARPTWFHGAMRILHAVLKRYAERNKTVNPWPAHIKIPKSETRSPPRALTDPKVVGDVIRAMRALASDAGRALEFMALTGMRGYDVRRLTDANIQRGFLISTTKSIDLDIPLSPRALELVAGRKGPLFPVTQERLRRAAEQVSKSAGIWLTPHTLGRKMFESCARSALGIDRAITNELSGRAQKGLDGSYVRATAEKLLEAATRVADWYETAAKQG